MLKCASSCRLLHTVRSSIQIQQKDIGLYRDDGLAVSKDISGPQSERIKKEFQKVFKKHDLEIGRRKSQILVRSRNERSPRFQKVKSNSQATYRTVGSTTRGRPRWRLFFHDREKEVELLTSLNLKYKECNQISCQEVDIFWRKLDESSKAKG